jgi:hypothetical protein
VWDEDACIDFPCSGAAYSGSTPSSGSGEVGGLRISKPEISRLSILRSRLLRRTGASGFRLRRNYAATRRRAKEGGLRITGFFAMMQSIASPSRSSPQEPYLLINMGAGGKGMRKPICTTEEVGYGDIRGNSK